MADDIKSKQTITLDQPQAVKYATYAVVNHIQTSDYPKVMKQAAAEYVAKNNQLLLALENNPTIDLNTIRAISEQQKASDKLQGNVSHYASGDAGYQLVNNIKIGKMNIANMVQRATQGMGPREQQTLQLLTQVNAANQSMNAVYINLITSIPLLNPNLSRYPSNLPDNAPQCLNYYKKFKATMDNMTNILTDPNLTNATLNQAVGDFQTQKAVVIAAVKEMNLLRSDDKVNESIISAIETGCRQVEVLTEQCMAQRSTLDSIPPEMTAGHENSTTYNSESGETFDISDIDFQNEDEEEDEELNALSEDPDAQMDSPMPSTMPEASKETGFVWRYTPTPPAVEHSVRLEN